MASILITGGANVGKSSYRLKFVWEGIERHVLIDAGSDQGAVAKAESDPVDPSLPDWRPIADEDIDAVVITHVHGDHINALPCVMDRSRLKLRPKARIYLGVANAALARYLLPANAALASSLYKAKKGPAPSFTMAQAQATCGLFSELPWKTPTQLMHGVPSFVKIHVAGHVVVATMPKISFPVENGNLLFELLIMADYSKWNQGIIPGAALDQLPAVDAVVLETTYGMRKLKDARKEMRRLLKMARLVTGPERRGVMAIFTFQLGRFQRLLWELRRANLGVPLYLVGKGAQALTRIIEENSGDLTDELQNIILSGRSPFDVGEWITPEEVAEKIAQGPCIILQAGGMIPEGAEYLLELIAGDPRNAAVLSGYAAKGTIAEQVANLVEPDPADQVAWHLWRDMPRTITIASGEIELLAEAISISLSGHAGGDHGMETVERLVRANPYVKFILVHGEPIGKADFAAGAKEVIARVLLELGVASTSEQAACMAATQVIIPNVGDEIPLEFPVDYEEIIDRPQVEPVPSPVLMSSEDLWEWALALGTNVGREGIGSGRSAAWPPALLAARLYGGTQPGKFVQQLEAKLTNRYFQRLSGAAATYRARSKDEVAAAKATAKTSPPPGRLIIASADAGSVPRLCLVAGWVGSRALLVSDEWAEKIVFPQSTWIDTGVDLDSWTGLPDATNLRHEALRDYQVCVTEIQQRIQVAPVDLSQLWHKARVRRLTELDAVTLFGVARSLWPNWERPGDKPFELELATAWSLATRAAALRLANGCWGLADVSMDATRRHRELVGHAPAGTLVRHASGPSGIATGRSWENALEVEVSTTTGLLMQKWKDGKVVLPSERDRECPP